MELTEQELRKLEKSTAESFASLSIGLWSVTLIGYLTSGISWHTYFLVVAGALFAVFGAYFILPWGWKRKECLKFLEGRQIMKITKLLGWLVVLAVFGVSLIQTGVVWLILTGLITIIIAPIVFSVGLLRMNEDNKKERHA